MSYLSPSHGHSHLPERRKLLKKGFSFLGMMAAASPRASKANPSDGKPVATAPHLSPPRPDASSHDPTSFAEAPESRFVFDAHLHCPSETGHVWQWYPVTKSFAEFAAYLEQTGVNRGIINNVRCQLATTPADFIAGNREVARYVDKYKGRFLGARVVNPLFIDEALKEIEYCRKELGFVWVGELCNYTVPYQYSAKEFEMLVGQVEKLNMVLDVHTELEEMEYIISKIPQCDDRVPPFR